MEIFVVDNDSGDGTAEMIRTEFPQVKLTASAINLGFAKANNLALKQATGDHILLLNPDTELRADTLQSGIKFCQSHIDCGAVGPKMFYPDGSLQSSVRRWPTVWPILLMLFKLPKIFPHLKSIDNYLAIDFDYDRVQAVDQIMGAFMLMPRIIYDKIGGLDERFFAWFEEVDYCRRIAEAGYKIYYSPDFSIVHHGGKSFAQQAIITNQKVFFISALKYFLKYAGLA